MKQHEIIHRLQENPNERIVRFFGTRQTVAYIETTGPKIPIRTTTVEALIRKGALHISGHGDGLFTTHYITLKK